MRWSVRWRHGDPGPSPKGPVFFTQADAQLWIEWRSNVALNPLEDYYIIPAEPRALRYAEKLPTLPPGWVLGEYEAEFNSWAASPLQLTNEWGEIAP